MSKEKNHYSKNGDLFITALFYVGIVGFLCLTLYNINATSRGLLGSAFPKVLYQIAISFWYGVYSLACLIFYHPLSKQKDNRLSPFQLHMGMAKFQGGLVIILIITMFSM